METRPQRTGNQLPASIGRYRVTGRLGKGAMGIVYSAYDDLMERPVAIKVMMADVQDDPETSARFYREAHAAGQLVHRNIITIFDLGDDDGRPYIVMELLESRTLTDYLRRPEGVRLEEKISLMSQLCEGLQLAHGKGIFHRDIKPGNLLISDDGSLKIVDFGIARLSTSSMTMSGLIVGTPDYMSPEQARGGDVDERSDIFSAGAVFYYMLTGRKPFAAANLAKVLEKVQSEDPLPIREAEAPQSLVNVVIRALAKSPADRYQKAAVLWADLVRVERELAHESRRISDEVRAELTALSALAAERAALGAELQTGPGAVDLDAYRRGIIERFPHAADWLAHRSNEFWDWAAARDRRREIAELGRDLESEVAALRQVKVDLASAVKATRANELQTALASFDAVLRAVPTHASARDERVRILALIAERQAMSDRTRALMAEAQQAAGRSAWTVALELTTQVLAIDTEHPGAMALRDRARDGVAAEARNRQLQCERALERAERSARKGRFDEADQAIAEARTWQPDATAIADVEERVRTARLDAERASALERRSADIIGAARQRFDSGEVTEAIDDLRTFLAAEPEAQSVATALTRFTADAERLRAEERKRAEANELARSAEAALADDDPQRALTLAQQALAADRREALAHRIEGLATARLREIALAREREEWAEQAMTNAEALLARGRFGAARDLALRAADLRPADPRPAALLAGIDRAEAESKQQAEREEAARRRAKAVAPVLAKARKAEGRSDFVQASWLAENALAIDVDCAEARQILERTRAKMAAQPALDDDTVKMGTAGAGADTEDTLTLSAPSSAWERVVGLFSGLLGALGIGRRTQG